MHFRIREKKQYIGEFIDQGDIIKIGRIKFKLRKYNLNYDRRPPKRGSRNLKKVENQQQEKERLVRQNIFAPKVGQRESVLQQNEEIPP